MNKQLLCFTFFMLICFTLPSAATAQVVAIPDANLRAAIENALGKPAGAPITADEMATLTRLEAQEVGIHNLTGLENATNLTWLHLGHNNITDISILAGLTKLIWLHLGRNNITDISILAGLTKLTTLIFYNNNISDISILAGLTKLTYLNLRDNNISDISPLVANTGLGSGDTVDVRGNPLGYLSLPIHTHIPILQSRGVTIEFDDRTHLNVGEPYTVRLIYFLPSDRQSKPDIDTQMDTLIKEVQQSYADDMEHHGFGRKTFAFETDATGKAVVHHVEGQFAAEHYKQGTFGKVLGEINEQFDTSKNIYLVVVDSGYLINGAPGVSTSLGGGAGGVAVLNSIDGVAHKVYLASHELRHTFGLVHDYRMDDRGFTLEISKCAAEFLDVHRYFNPKQPSQNTFNTTIQIFPPSLASPPNAIRLRFEVTDADGLHQAQLIGSFRYGEFEDINLLDCKRLDGNPSSLLEFVTTGVTPKDEGVGLNVIDVHGNVTWQWFPIDITSVLPPPKVVSIPDANLAEVVRETLGLSPGVALTSHTMLELRNLYAKNRQITDLIGLEHAHILRWLYLGDEWVSGQGYINSNTVSNFSPLSGLTRLRTLDLSGISISDVSPLADFTKLTELNLHNNSISDVSALAGLTKLTRLYLWNNSISDVSALAGLTKLNILWLNNNTISDVSPLAGLTKLNWLNLSNNSISDVSALSGLTQLTSLSLAYNSISDVSPLLGLNLTGTWRDSTGLYLQGNPLSYASINTHIPAIQAKGIEVKFDDHTPTTLVKISGTEQQTAVNATLSLPFVVEVRDERNRAFSGVPVTFTVTAGGGTLSVTNTTTNENGRAQVRLTLGQTAGTTTVSVAAAEISKPVHFSATAFLLSSLVTVPDPALRAKIAETVSKPPSGALTVGDMLRLTTLDANNANIRELIGLHYAANLITLSLDDNNLSDVSLLVELPQLETLSLDNNNLSDVASLAALTHLKTLHLRGNPLSYPSLRTHIPAMQASGVVITVDPRTPTTLLNISGAHGVTGATLPFVVEVQDQHNRAFSGVPVTFAVTAGGGRLSALTAITNITGRARTTLMLGGTPGENTVRVSAAEGPQPVRFTITAIDASSSVTVPDAALRAKIAETLNKQGGVQLTAGEMLTLIRLDALNANIQDLTGLEYAYNLITLNLSGERVSEQGYVNSNAVSNFSPLLGLTQLRTLNLSNNAISDVSALAGLTQLNTLHLYSNTIADVSALARLTQLNTLHLSNNAISDVSPLSG